MVTRGLIIRKIPWLYNHTAAALPRTGRSRDKREIQATIGIGVGAIAVRLTLPRF
jgi:hypothetical protein